MISHGYYPCIGGTERQAGALAGRLRKRGFDVHVLTRRMPHTDQFEVINGVPVHRLPARGPKFIASLTFTVSALTLMRKLNPDLIHAYELISPATTAVLAKKLFSIPAVVSVRTSGPTGDVKRLRSRLLGGIRLKWLYRSIDAFIVISKEIDALLAEEGVPDRKRILISNGVDVEHFSPSSKTEKADLRARMGFATVDELFAIYTGRLSPEKGVGNLVRVWPEIHKLFPNVKLLILGDGPEGALLRQMASDNIIFLGSKEDVASYLKISDLFVLPSLAEGLSNSLLEAMACGLPVVATSVGGNPELIRDRVTGRIVLPGDGRELQSAIVGLLADEGTRLKMGQRARDYVRKNYAFDKTIDKLQDFYRGFFGLEVTRA
jgi:glycosyltransferase involved in cell wall biosynthesis